MANPRIEMQERGLAILARNGGFKFTPTFVPYTSEEIGNYYVQSGDVQKRGVDYAQAIKDMTLLATSTFGGIPEVISGGETRDWIFSGPVAVALNVPHVMLYKDGKSVGADIKGRKLLHVADLNNEGSSPRDLWVPAIKKAGGTCEHIIFYVDRMEDGVEVMRKLGLASDAVVPLDSHAWDYLQKIEVVSPEVYKSLMQRMENKGEWARAMLRSDAGLETLAGLLKDPKNREKAKKIIFKGYPDMRQELLDNLRSKFGPDFVMYATFNPDGGFL